MHGTPPAPYPRRVVCLTSDTTEIALAAVAGDRAVGRARHYPAAAVRGPAGRALASLALRPLSPAARLIQAEGLANSGG